jgi:alpha-galactosidase
LTAFRPAAAETVWLSALDVSKTVQSTGQAHADKSYVGKPLSIAGRKFERGVGTHAISTLVIDLKQSAVRFTAFVGIDDDTIQHPGSVEFRVIGDSRTLWKSGLVKSGQAPRPVDVDLRGIKLLILRVGDAKDGIGCDHGDWADAKIEFSGPRPETVVSPVQKQDQAVILTPAPRINGARVFGVRPGHPLLFTIAATGQRPMEFAAEGLPPGLRLDPHTGRISGAVHERGEYPVTLRAKNALGTAGQKFKIVCGDRLALTPHMGWNSWYVWGRQITDQRMREAAAAMVSSGLADHGYMYVNLDDCWTNKPGSTDPLLTGPARDAQGNIRSNGYFPDMQALADYIHGLGLKAGIYTGPVPLTCAQHVGSAGHEEQDARQYARWGYDFLKLDSCYRGNVPQMGAILARLDRDVVYNVVSGGKMETTGQWARSAGVHSWRTAIDLGGSWRRMLDDVFGLYGRNEIQKSSGPGGWNDPDYLSLGHLRGGGTTVLTPNQQYSYVSIWCLLTAPLIFSGDLTRLDPFTLSLLTNDEVIEVDQDPLGKAALRVAKTGDLEVWAKDLEDGRKAVGLFNLDKEESLKTAEVTVNWSDVGLHGPQIVRDLWRQKDIGTFDGRFTARVEPDGVVLVSLRPARIP